MMMRKWDLETGLQVNETQKGQTNAVVAMDVSHDERMVASGSVDHTVIGWGSGEMVHDVEGHQALVRSVWS
ncbi:hypothetical protein BS17DRAFT_776382 [Gyrodon lividus]|nr:hypothetical protein BS17DRAFT_776382 [Gyrodon lividus]